MSSASHAGDAVPERVIKSVDGDVGGRAALQTWTGQAISEQIYSKSLAAAYRQWQFHRASGLPRLRDMFAQDGMSFEDTELTLKLGNEHLIIGQSDGFIRKIGQDLRGFKFSELKFKTAQGLLELLDDCITNRKPIYGRYISSLSETNMYWETLLLPLAAVKNGAPLFVLRYAATISEKTDIMQILYDRSPIGIVAAVPTVNTENQTDDARILTMNAKARQILRQEDVRFPLHSVGELIRYLHDTLKWACIQTTVDGGATNLDYRAPDGLEFSMAIELVNQMVVISFTERGRPEPKATSRFARLMGLG